MPLKAPVGSATNCFAPRNAHGGLDRGDRRKDWRDAANGRQIRRAKLGFVPTTHRREKNTAQTDAWTTQYAIPSKETSTPCEKTAFRELYRQLCLLEEALSFGNRLALRHIAIRAFESGMRFTRVLLFDLLNFKRARASYYPAQNSFGGRI
jgi:hypothetical protein